MVHQSIFLTNLTMSGTINWDFFSEPYYQKYSTFDLLSYLFPKITIFTFFLSFSSVPSAEMALLSWFADMWQSVTGDGRLYLFFFITVVSSGGIEIMMFFNFSFCHKKCTLKLNTNNNNNNK